MTLGTRPIRLNRVDVGSRDEEKNKTISYTKKKKEDDVAIVVA